MPEEKNKGMLGQSSKKAATGSIRMSSIIFSPVFTGHLNEIYPPALAGLKGSVRDLGSNRGRLYTVEGSSIRRMQDRCE
jgi:hypothetical protein